MFSKQYKKSKLQNHSKQTTLPGHIFARSRSTCCYVGVPLGPWWLPLAPLSWAAFAFFGLPRRFPAPAAPFGGTSAVPCVVLCEHEWPI